MSDEYEKFARHAYNTVLHAMQDGLKSNHGKPLLIMSGESHEDPWDERWLRDTFTRASKEQPAMASAYVHMATMMAAAKLVGKENVVVSFEQTTKQIDEITRNLRLGIDPGVEIKDKPMIRSLVFASKMGFKIVGSDDGRIQAFRDATDSNHEVDLNKVMDNLGRYSEERRALNALGLGAANSPGQTPKIVVQIGGAAHIQMLHGYGPTDDVEHMTAVQKVAVKNPFEKVFGKPVFVNSGDNNNDGDVTFKFITDPKNAIQLIAPGAMDADDIKKADDRVKAVDAATHIGAAAAATPVFRVPGGKP